MNFAERLKQRRIEKGLTKSQLAEMIGIHYAQIGRYENKGAQPSAEVLSKIANALEVSTEFILNGTTDDLATSTINDKELLSQFKAILQFPNDKQAVIKDVLDAYILKVNLQQKLGA